MSRRRVVVTGLGCISPVGNTVAEAWANLLAGQSGIDRITKFDASNFSCQIAGEVKGFNVEEYMSAKDARSMDTFIHYGIAAADQAVKDAGLPTGEALSDDLATRIGCVIGSGIGGLPLIENTQIELSNRGPRRITPFFVPASIINMVAGHVSMRHGFKGPNLSVVTACTTGLHCIGEAGRMIEYGDADIVIAGGAESTVSPLGIGGFAAMRALSTRNDDPKAASRPWDKDRDGFVLGEGAGVLVLEEYEHAKARGAKIYAELGGYGMSADAGHMTAPNMDGPRRAMLNAMRNAGVNPDQINYLNAHGTSTPLGDKNESNAIKAALGDAAYKTVVSSTKSMTGHLLGGAGGIESVFTVMAIHDQKIPPTINLLNQDPDCDLDYCANVARDAKIDVALKNNFGFGGTNGSLIFKRI
ncbi:beta-ketoacyl-ACP synthase II [Comamonas kerstersii]|jgi:3-oxoacyl-[acyl-carrier-protein] synthase II|uniref:3-oxoacyl-[acyl-carrier-protein] synthase 2 n=1 Tax=Comamonas kerstersii TaxID=225992 RepID=A0A0W7YXI4_9BURK|nr:beta-ketoacyl-ACP synthase II [Comamonas kerstersii]AQZ97243.1 beta-ketoacyl-[acyl-carrier-protein] synthase II [Comamonas kerstersii]KAB0586973.1 beta-ketoacyl-ACP synthase II [Comamonas kerstersii]KUF39795.1 beta-ketoacyl-[acyl-carrier-protein] synthase II [Comamonas kerstersii]QTW18557.1 beta-ketoacyl-ACP synthase II [Comamonas kerstersii]HBW61689.1 beta-ketoacyl-[acyl-carrier-protein] synthase II [Comamonas kerstersii]